MTRPGITFEVLRPSPGPLVRADRGAIVGLFERGPADRLAAVGSLAELDAVFGCDVPGMLAPRSARAFFENGGAELLVSRVVPPGSSAAAASMPLVDGGALPLAARDPGAFGNRMRVEGRLHLERRVPAVVTSDTELAAAGASLADADKPIRVSDGALHIWTAVITATPGVGYTVSPPLPAGTGPDVLVTVFANEFQLRVSEPGRADVEIEGLSLATSQARSDFAARLEGTPLALDGALPPASAISVPLPGVAVALRGGDDGLSAGSSASLAGAFDAAFDLVDASPLPDIVFCPDLWSRIYATKNLNRLALDDSDARARSIDLVRRAARLSDRVVLLDPPLDPSTLEPLSASQLARWKDELVAALGADRDFAAAYTPWVRTLAPALRYRGDETLLEPPSGFVAGRIARTALTRGAWIATGNVAVAGVLGASRTLSERELDAIDGLGINPLVSGPGGLGIEGVRSLSYPDRPEWRFLSSRRLFNYLRRALLPLGMSYVFEPNGPATWAQLRRDLEGLLRDLFARGAFAGASMRDAFFVKVDASLNPAEARENGVLTAQIGVAPAAPLEFLIVRLVARREGAAVTLEAA